MNAIVNSIASAATQIELETRYEDLKIAKAQKNTAAAKKIRAQIRKLEGRQSSNDKAFKELSTSTASTIAHNLLVTQMAALQRDLEEATTELNRAKNTIGILEGELCHLASPAVKAVTKAQINNLRTVINTYLA